MTERFDKFYAPVGKDLCWTWIGAKAGKYGVFTVNRRNVYAHRFQYERWTGKQIPQGFVVMHSCDNPSCVNPFHLSVGTQRENIADAVKKGRIAKGEKHGLVKNPMAAARGEKVASSKLTSQQVDEIRRLYVKGTPGKRSQFSLSGLAKKYGVAYQTISKVVNKRNWK